MDLELSVSSGAAKARVVSALVEKGFTVRSGAVRLAFPFTVLVHGIDAEAVPAVRHVVLGVDPGAGVIEPAVSRR